MPFTINDWLTIGDEHLDVRVSRASGPGGQNVNKVSSRVELLVNLDGLALLPPYAKEKLESLEHKRISKENVLRIVCQNTRDQARNKELCFDKLKELVLACLDRPPPRRPTKPSRAAKTRRVAGKRHRSDIKKMRSGSAD